MILPLPRLRLILAFFGAILLVAVAVGCGADDDGAVGGGPRVAATTTIWADVVANVACDGAADVFSLIPPGGDPHTFEPSLADRGRLDAAALVVSNGLGLEAGLADTLDAVAAEGTPVFVMTDLVDTLPFGDDHEGQVDGDDHDGEVESVDDDHGHEGDDPHVWHDPTRVVEALPALAEALVAAGADADAVAECLDSYTAALEAVDAEVAATLAAVPDRRRVLVTSHEAFAYLADRYGFEVVGTVLGSSTLAETNPAALEALAEVVEETGVPAVFAETQHSTADLEALADRVGGVSVVELFSGTLGPPGSGADTYLGLLRTNAERIADALGG